jgi:peptide/nickel transport system permease protein
MSALKNVTAGLWSAWRFFKKRPLGLIGTTMIIAWVMVLILAPYIAPFGFRDQDIPGRLQPPSAKHLLGTDELGRDVLSRILWGGRVTVPLGIGVVILGACFGTLAGASAAFFGGILDDVVMRLTDMFLAFPPVILALALAAALGADLGSSMLAMIAVWWPSYARMVRGVVVSEKNRDYVLASRALGASPWYLLLRRVLPNSVTPIVVMAIVDFGNGIMVAAALNFLGLGVRPPTAEWGAMISSAVSYLDQWWLSVFPGLAITTFLIGTNFFGDAIRDAWDPRLRRVT